ncbi:MAG: DUF885 domain-containing protein [Pyrinomonadaceae bacterium]
MKIKIFLAILFLGLFSIPLVAQPSAVEVKKLNELFDSEWERGLSNNPERATYLGDERWNDRWTDVSLDSIEKRHQEDLETLKKIKEIDENALSESDRLNLTLFRKQYENRIERYRFKEFLLPINQQGGIQTAQSATRFMKLESIKQYEDWLSRMNSFDRKMDQVLALMREGKRLGIMLPKVVLSRVPTQIKAQIVEDPEKSPWFEPFGKIPASFADGERERLQESAKEAIRAKIVPSYSRLYKYFTEEYLPAAYPKVGVWQHPDGAEYYAFLARSFTTTSMSPEEIHQKGLSEVSRIRAEMEKIKSSVGFKGSLKEFFAYLRTDEKFFFKTPEELLTAYRATAKRIDPLVPRVVKTLPRTPYGVIPIPDQIAPDTTTAYYNPPAADGSRPGYYSVNLYKPETRPKWEMMALTIHEAVPGHHLQIAIQQELGELPKFRRFGGFTAFTEGWGLYSESLGEDMGLYEDPYDKFGQLTYEMWRAVRLVVDTGMHYYKWDREKAIEFFRDNAAKTDQDIVNEIDRYISDPGQALAYKIGELKMQELRTRAEKRLGSRFDLREFNDAILKNGAVPLDVLETKIEEFIGGK